MKDPVTPFVPVSVPPNGSDLFSPEFRGVVWDMVRIPAEVLRTTPEYRTATEVRAIQANVQLRRPSRPDTLEELLPKWGVSVDEQAKGALSHYWGYPEFRYGQLDVIKQVIEGRDALLVMPTGGGKSLCYQIPALLLPGTAIVVSPLIALMKDQVDALRARGVEAEYLNSSQTQKEADAVLDMFASGNLKLLYIAPERFKNHTFVETLATATRRCGKTKISLLAIDESHCISQWGHDFRPDYRRLGEFRSALGTHVFATTATATVKVQDDIAKQLRMEDPFRLVTGFDRPNLTLEIKYLFSEIEKNRLFENLVVDILHEAVKAQKVSPLIIYCGRRKDTENTAQWVNQLAADEGFTGKLMAPYHAGLKDDERKQVQDDFMNGRTPWVTATCAFGMGVDKADIRHVIHLSIPGSIEAWYQEIGRAGRDGKNSRTILLASPQDESLQWFFVEMSNPAKYVITNVYDVLWQWDQQLLRKTYDAVYHDYVAWYGRGDPQAVVDTAIRMLKKSGALNIESPRGQIWMGTPKKENLDNYFDWKLLAEKRKRDEERLREMLTFVKSKEDKRRLLLRYFGEIK